MGAGIARGAFGDRLRLHREAAGYTQEELAERAGLTTKAISALERGERRRPYPNTVRAIADALQLSDADRARLIAAVPTRAAGTDGGAPPAASAPGSDLPPETTPLLGRAEELAILRDQLLDPQVRLLTIVGPGGVGKTRLATAVARALTNDGDFPGGVWFVDLSTVDQPAQVVAAVARAVGAGDSDPDTTRDRVRLFVGGRRLLLVLDNFEQVLPGAAEIGTLLGESPGLTVLVTSREPLRLRWERTLPLLPLALPDPVHLPPIDRLAKVPAVALFVERARAAAPAFELTPANARAVADLCVRLDGLPLAIELVAARAAQFGPAATLDRLARRLPVPTAAMRDAPSRQQSLRATLQWSLELLSEDERTLFRRLGVFAGGCGVAAAEAVAGAGIADVLGGLTSLSDKSLVAVHAVGRRGSGPEEPRFRMLETAREVALDLLDASGEAEDVRLGHAAHFASLAESASQHLEGSAHADIAARLEREDDNFRQALDWARGRGTPEALEVGLRLVGALAWYWFLHGYPAEARGWFDVLLGAEAAGGEPAEPEGGDEQARSRRAKALNAAGFRATDQGEYGLAATFHQQALTTWRHLRDVPGMVASLHGVGDTALWMGNAELAEASYLEGLDLAHSEGAPQDVALFAFHLGQLSWLVGRLDAAVAYGEDALAVARAAGNTTWPRYALFVLASVSHERGDTQRAGTLYREALGLAWEHHDRLCVRMALPGLAALATLEGDPVRALRLAGAASALEENAGIWAFPPIRERHERWLAAAQRLLDADARAAAWDDGRRLTIDEVIAHALEETVPAPAAGRRALGIAPQRLSPREQEVLQLVARGNSNRRIADALFVTEHTAKYHVTSLFNKLGAANRAEAVARAIALGLLTPSPD